MIVKKIKTGLIKCLLITALMCAGYGLFGGGLPEAKAGSFSHRGVWVAFYEFSSIGLSNRTEASFRKNATTMFKNIKSYGCNEVFFHVRAFDDAIYPSKVVKWSTYMESNRRSPGYDPLKILVELAHKQNLKFHAWMNPYRVSTTRILNPGSKKTINRIVRQVKEIINNYEVDGIHFDDYFYNGKKYAKVKGKTRRKNVNKMVKKVYKTVKAKNKDLQFGISPAGNYEYAMEIGADVDTWLSKSGYIDYLIPQIYWTNQYKLNGKMTTLFSNRLKTWRELNKIDLPMYIGLGVYRAGYKVSPDLGWSKKETNLAEQAQEILSGNSEGYTLFAYSDMIGSHATYEMESFIEKIAWISLNRKAVTLKKGETFQLTAKWKPSIYSGESVEFRSLDESIATVDDNGLITAVADSGVVKIQVTGEGKKKNCTVTIGDGNGETKS